MSAVPCETCEMQNSCARDGMCYRPRTPDHLIREYEKAAQAYDVAAKNLIEASKAVQQILKEGTL
jgi:hypothetical protein